MKQNALSPFPSFLHLSRKAPTLDQCQKIVVWLAKFHRSFWEKRKTVSKTAEAGLPVDVQQLVTGSDSKLWPLFMKSSEKERYELFELLDPDGFKVKKKRRCQCVGLALNGVQAAITCRVAYVPNTAIACCLMVLC